MIKITSTQIPRFWEVIKYSALHSDQVDKKYQTKYCINLLIDLLSERKHCYIIKEDSKIAVVVIISFYIDKGLDINGVCVSNLYSFTTNARKYIPSIEDNVIEIAKKNGCKVIITETSNKVIDNMLSKSKNIDGIMTTKKYIYFL